MVFIRPTILRDGEDAVPVTQQKLELMRLEEMRKRQSTTAPLIDEGVALVIVRQGMKEVFFPLKNQRLDFLQPFDLQQFVVVVAP